MALRCGEADDGLDVGSALGLCLGEDECQLVALGVQRLGVDVNEARLCEASAARALVTLASSLVKGFVKTVAEKRAFSRNEWGKWLLLVEKLTLRASELGRKLEGVEAQASYWRMLAHKLHPEGDRAERALACALEACIAQTDDLNLKTAIWANFAELATFALFETDQEINAATVKDAWETVIRLLGKDGDRRPLELLHASSNALQIAALTWTREIDSSNTHFLQCFGRLATVYFESNSKTTGLLKSATTIGQILTEISRLVNGSPPQWDKTLDRTMLPFQNVSPIVGDLMEMAIPQYSFDSPAIDLVKLHAKSAIETNTQESIDDGIDLLNEIIENEANNVSKGRQLYNLANALLNHKVGIKIENLATAVRLLGDCRQHFERASDLVLVDLAQSSALIQQRDFASACDLANSCLEGLDALDPDYRRQAETIALLNFGKARAALGDVDGGMAALVRGFETCDESSLLGAIFHKELADVYIMRDSDSLEKAKDHLAKAKIIFENHNQKEESRRTRLQLARANLILSRQMTKNQQVGILSLLYSAIAEAQAVQDECKLLLRIFDSFRERRHVRSEVEAAGAVLVELRFSASLFQNHPALKSLEMDEVILAMESSRAQGLAEIVAEYSFDYSHLSEENQHELQTIQCDILCMQLNLEKTTTACRSQLRSRCAALEKRRGEILNEKKCPKVPPQSSPFKIAHLWRALGVDNTAIVFYFTDTRIHLFALGQNSQGAPHGCYVHRERWDVDFALKRFQCCSPYSADFNTVLGEIGRSIPFEALFRNMVSEGMRIEKNIVIVPHRGLHRVPLDQIPFIFQRETTTLSHLVGEEWGISFAPSLELYTRAQTESKDVVLSRLATVADPAPKFRIETDYARAYASSNGYQAVDIVVGGSGGLNLDSAIRTETTAGFLHQLRKVSSSEGGRSLAVHASCHASFDKSDPRFTSFHLGGNERVGGDCDLSIPRIIASMCEFHDCALWIGAGCQTTGLEDADGLDDCVGLSTAILAAGVPYVIGTLWKVDMENTERMMCLFHEKLWKFPSQPGKALSAAKREMRGLSFDDPGTRGMQAVDDFGDLVDHNTSVPKNPVNMNWAAFVVVGALDNSPQAGQKLPTK